jgi:hypothetical protein
MRQKADRLKRKGPNWVSPDSSLRCDWKSKYEKIKKPEASRTWEIAEAVATRFHVSRSFKRNALNQVNKW